MVFICFALIKVAKCYAVKGVLRCGEQAVTIPNNSTKAATLNIYYGGKGCVPQKTIRKSNFPVGKKTFPDSKKSFLTGKLVFTSVKNVFLLEKKNF